MKITLTIFVLSLAMLLVCWVYESLDPYNDTNANIGIAALVTTFLSGLLAVLLSIWS